MELKDYKNVFVFAEQREGNIQSVAFELLGKARESLPCCWVTM